MPLTLSGTNGVSGVDGSNTTPAIKGGTSTGTGVFYGTNTVSLATGGTTAVTVDSSQNVGIGTASPGAKLHLSGGLRVADSTNSANYIVVGSGNEAPIGANSVVSQAGNLVVGTVAASTVLQLATSGSERARITSGGDVYFGQTTGATPPTSGADLVAGGLVINPSRRTTAATTPVCVWDSTSGTFSRSTSSLKYKKDVQNATYGLSDVLSLRPVTFKGKSDGDRIFGGLIAEEVDAAGLTMFVDYAEDGTPDGLGYSAMVSLAFKAIQELSAKLDAAEARIAALEAK